MEVRDISLQQVVPVRNLRSESTDTSELQASISEHGVLQPIRVRPIGQRRFQIIAGHRRFAACRALGVETIPAVIVQESDERAAVQTIVENLQREDLTPIDLTRGIKELQTSFSMNPDEIGAAISKSPAQVRNYLRIARLPDTVLEHLESGEGRTQTVRGLTPRHIQPLLGDVPVTGADDADVRARVAEATTTISQLRAELETRGVRINAHMADAIGRNVRSGRMTIPDAVDEVLANPEKYRYTKPTSTAEELERDTWGAYRSLQREFGSVAYKLRPEIAMAFSPAQRRDLLEQLEPHLARIEQYRGALLAGGTGDAQAMSLTEGRSRGVELD